ncbi:type VI secretion system baseplate subunit TssE [Methylibium rhizosphaerae]|uniref:type VI secretion system baseplate subunit TssE n=1 Tax=Methylibium rhizosphaerae TaxID=2570323 RepID=UPI001126D083|nr:type VI secretion system baseplate subunit TssE [Methylibium rhizosphaerae]
MHRFIPSLLDRLIDHPPRAGGSAVKPTLSIDELKASVARDVESLLNSRRGTLARDLKGFPLSQRSLLAFGLDDFVSMSMVSSVDRDAICRSLEGAIARHEPRLAQVRVSIENDPGATDRLRFAIHALLQAHPLQEPVSFDAVLHTMTQQYDVRSGRPQAEGARRG